MKMLNHKTIYKIYIGLILIVLFMLSITVSIIRVDAKDNNIETYKTPQKPAITLKASEFSVKEPVKPKEKCYGTWIETSATNRINLETTSLFNWKADSKPSVIIESVQSINKVIIGHNYCYKNVCNNAGTDFAKIINLKINDQVTACVNNQKFEGKVYVANAFPESATYILGDWLKKDSLTLFTSFGKCKDAICSVSEERWVVGVR